MKNRIDIIDALRGFALAGIVIVHMVEQFSGGPEPEGVMTYAHEGIANSVVDAIIIIFLRGKFFALFSFLFGLSFFIQMDNADQKGQRYAGRFIWRAVLLFVIGYLHHLFYRGDILTIYAILAIPLVPFFKTDKKWTWLTIILIFTGVFRFLVFYLFRDQSIFGSAYLDIRDPSVLAYWNILQEGTFGQVAVSNATEGMLSKLDFQFGIIYRGYLTFAFFLLGLWTGKTGYFRDYGNYLALTRKILWYAIGSIVLFTVVSGFFFQKAGPDFSFDQWLPVLGLNSMDIANLAMTVAIVCLFVLAYHTKRGQRWLSVFSPYGRMALTNYVLQTIIGTFILYGWGLGYIGKWENIHLFLLALIVIAGQIWLSRIWLNNFRYGPLEWLWRSGTWLRWQPLKK